MEKQEQLDNLKESLDKFNPELDDRESLIRNIMESTSNSVVKPGIDRIIALLFGWTDILWIRRGLVTISVALVFVFVFQQFTIINRIGQLEDRMVESNTEQIIRQQGENVLLNSVIMQEISETEIRDSVVVADKDLKDLINSYSELQRRYQDLKRELYSQEYSSKIINQEL